VFPDASACYLEELARNRWREPAVVILVLWLNGLHNFQNPESNALNPVDDYGLKTALDLACTCVG
jgi:hypothetical protein